MLKPIIVLSSLGQSLAWHENAHSKKKRSSRVLGIAKARFFGATQARKPGPLLRGSHHHLHVRPINGPLFILTRSWNAIIAHLAFFSILRSRKTWVFVQISLQHLSNGLLGRITKSWITITASIHTFRVCTNTLTPSSSAFFFLPPSPTGL